MTTLIGFVAPAPLYDRAYQRRIGQVTALAEVVEPEMRISRLRQIVRTWRSCLAWRLAVALRESPLAMPARRGAS